MNEIEISIEQMVSDIASQAFDLEPSRLRLFLEWLVSHSSMVRESEAIRFDTKDRKQVEMKLKAWFEALPADGLAWEYDLLLGEIAWWHNLDSSSHVLQTNQWETVE